MTQAVLNNNENLTLRCPFPHGHQRVLSTNLSILLHIAIFAIPLLLSYLPKKVHIAKEKPISVNLVTIAAPAFNGDIENSKIVKNRKNNTKQIVEKQNLEKEEKIEKQNPIKKEVKEEVKKPVEVKKVEKREIVKKFGNLAPKAGEQKIVKKTTQKTSNNKVAATRRQITANNNGNSSSTIKILGEGDYIRTTPPQYPRRAVRLGMQGTVTVKALINRSGKAEKVMISSSSGFSILDNSAVKAVSKWFFKPSSLNDNFNKTWVKVPVKFVLR